MMRAVSVPPAARAALVVALKEESRHAAALPDPLPMGRVLRIVDKNVDSTAELKVFAGKDEKGYFLDYFVVNNDKDGQTFWHGRIREDGTVEELENYEGQWGRPFFPGDPAKTEAELQRIIAHNARVEGVLRAKGFK
jgi:hypothetical protein